MKKYFLYVTVCILTLLCASCSKTNEFTVEMYGKTSNERVNMTVTLPKSSHENDITFTVNNVIYTCSNLPSVASPKYIFDDANDDGIKTVTLTN